MNHFTKLYQCPTAAVNKQNSLRTSIQASRKFKPKYNCRLVIKNKLSSLTLLSPSALFGHQLSRICIAGQEIWWLCVAADGGWWWWPCVSAEGRYWLCVAEPVRWWLYVAVEERRWLCVAAGGMVWTPRLSGIVGRCCQTWETLEDLQPWQAPLSDRPCETFVPASACRESCL